MAGLFWFAALRRAGELRRRRWVGGLTTGAGGFQLYDGTVQHKLLRLHQIRYDVDLLPYDLTWDVVAVLLLVVGVVLLLCREPARARG